MPPKAKKKAAAKKRGMKTEKKNFTFVTHVDPMRQVPGTSNYLDDVQRHEAETARAKVEGREPDYDNMGSTQGTPLLLTDVVKTTVPGDVEVKPDVELDVSAEEAPEPTNEPSPYDRQSVTVDVRNG